MQHRVTHWSVPCVSGYRLTVWEIYDGHVYVVQGHKIPLDQMSSLGEKFKKLPEGWKYQVVTPSEDLVMNLTPAHAIPSVQDEFDQIYIRIPE